MNKSITKTVMFLILCIAILVSLCLKACPANCSETKPVGMILEVKGYVMVIQKGKKGTKAQIMMPLYDGSKVITGKNGSLLYVKYKNGREYRVEPNSTIIFRGDIAVVSKGKSVPVFEKSSLPLPRSTAVASRKILGQVLKIQKKHYLQILSPENGEALADLEVKIRWASKLHDNFQIIITEKGSEKILKPFPLILKNVQEFTFRNDPSLPFQLEYGKEYTLKLTGFKEDRMKVRPPNTKEGAYFEEKKVDFRILPGKKALEVHKVRAKFRDMIEKNKKNKRAYLLMADFYKEKGMYQKSIEVMKALKAIDRKNPYVYYYLGQLYEKLGRRNESTRWFTNGYLVEKGEKARYKD